MERDGEGQRGDSEGSKPVWLVTSSVGLFDVRLFSWGFLWAHEGGQWDEEMLPPQELHGLYCMNIIIFSFFMQQSPAAIIHTLFPTHHIAINIFIVIWSA